MFAKTRVEIADFHTTLSYFDKTQQDAGVLPLGTQSSYGDLYQRVCVQPRGLEYREASGGKAGKVFLRLEPFFTYDNFWIRYLETREYSMYPLLAWEYQVPLQVSLSSRVEYIPDPRFPCKVSPIITVVLFPFGWSTWLSLLVTGDHDLMSLSSFVEHVFNDMAFKLSGNPAELRLERLFKSIATGTMSDAFKGRATRERTILESLVTVTVLGKQRGTLASGGLSPKAEQALQRIVRPTGVPGYSAFQKQVHKLNIKPEDDPLYHFMFTDDFGRFTWYRRLLEGNKWDLKHLECYHNNIFRSFLLAFHQIRLLESALRVRKELQPELHRLVEYAVYNLKDPTYRNKSLKYLFEREDVKKTLAAANKRWLADDVNDDS